MSWLIFIHSYLIRNSVRRWLEQPLSLLSKLTVAALLGVFTTLVLAGLRGLGEELDRRLKDREILTAYVTESFNSREALEVVRAKGSERALWDEVVANHNVVYRANATAQTNSQKNLPILAVENIEYQGLVDDFYLLDGRLPEEQIVEFQVGGFHSEAIVKAIPEEFQFALLSRPGLLANFDRISPLLVRGFSKTSVLKAANLSELESVQTIVDTLRKVEGRRVFLQSNLSILREIEKIKSIQVKALVAVTLMSAAILGLIFGSLAWLEFREERYVLALIRSFGVRSSSVVIHSLFENCLVACCGVFCGIIGLHFLSSMALKMNASISVFLPKVSVITPDIFLLMLGSIIGGLLAAIPVFIGLRKPLGLVLS